MATIPIQIVVNGFQPLNQLAMSTQQLTQKVNALRAAGLTLNQAQAVILKDTQDINRAMVNHYTNVGQAAAAQRTLAATTAATSRAIQQQRQQVRDLRTAIYGLAGVGAILGGIGYGALRMAESFQKAQIEVDGIDNRLRNLTNRQITIGLRAPGDLSKIRNVADTVTQQAGMPSIGTMREAAVILESYSVKSKDIERLLPLIQRQVETMKAKGLTLSPALVAKQLGVGYTDISLGRLKRAGATVNPADEMAVKQAKALGAEAGRAEYMRRVIVALDHNTVSLGSSLSEAAKNANRLAAAWQKFQISPMGRGFTSVLFEVFKLITSILETMNKFSQTHPTIARLIGLFFGLGGAVTLLIAGMLGLVIAVGQVFIAVEAVQVAFAAATVDGAALAGLSFAGLVAGLGTVAAAATVVLGLFVTIGASIYLLSTHMQDIQRALDLLRPGARAAYNQIFDESNKITGDPTKSAAERAAAYQKAAGKLKARGYSDEAEEAQRNADQLLGKKPGAAALAANGIGAAMGDEDKTREQMIAEAKLQKAQDAAETLRARENAAMLDASARERAETEKTAARDEAERIREAHRESRERDHEDLRRQIQEYEDAHKRTREADLNSAKGMLLLRHAGYNLPQILMAQRMEKLVRGAAGDEVSGETRRYVQEMRNAGRWRDIADARALHQELAEVQGRHGMAAAEDVYEARMAGAHGKAAGVTRARAGGALGVAQARYGASGAQTGPSQYANGHIKVPVTITIEDPVAHHARRVRR